jgi:hypothetical protein
LCSLFVVYIVLWHVRQRQGATRQLQLARMLPLPIGPGGCWLLGAEGWGPAVRFQWSFSFSFSTPRYVSSHIKDHHQGSSKFQGAFAKKKSGPRTPRPPGAPPAIPGFLGVARGRAKGCLVPSTRNWQLALPVAPVTVTHQPAPGDAQGNVSRQLAGAVVWGGGAAPAPPDSRAAGAPALLQVA